MGSTDYIREDIPLLDFILHNPTRLMIDGTCHAIELDTCGPANYLLSNNLKKELNENEIPH